MGSAVFRSNFEGLVMSAMAIHSVLRSSRLADFEASVREPDYADIGADLAKFLDVDNLVWMLTDDAEVVWDSRS